MYPNLFRFPEWLPFLGGEYVTTFGLAMFLSFVAAGLVVRSELDRNGYDPEKAWDMVFMAVIGGIVGAKLYYVLLNYPRLVADPVGMLFARGGMVFYGGFLLATVLVAWEIKRSGLPLREVADMSAPALALAYAIGRVGCFLVGDDWGRPTDLPWGVRFPQGAPPTSVTNIEQQFGIEVDPELIAQYGQIVPVHPTQLYEVALSTLIFAILWRLRFKDWAPGKLFLLWLAMATTERFLVEFLRAKDDRFFGALTLAQVLSLVLLGAAIWGFTRLERRPA